MYVFLFDNFDQTKLSFLFLFCFWICVHVYNLKERLLYGGKTRDPHISSWSLLSMPLYFLSVSLPFIYFFFFTDQVLNFFAFVELDHVSFMGFGYSMCLVYGCFEFFQFDSPWGRSRFWGTVCLLLCWLGHLLMAFIWCILFKFLMFLALQCNLILRSFY